MKIRTSFVSNSSSCSFTCQVCGATEAGSDSIGAEEYGFTHCQNYHEICLECLREERPEEPDCPSSDCDEKGDAKEGTPWFMWAEETEEGYYVPPRCCPICQFDVLSTKDTKRYLKKSFGVLEDEVFAEIKKLNKRRRKLYDSEYVSYVMLKHQLDGIKLLEEVKSKFPTYKEFGNYLREK